MMIFKDKIKNDGVLNKTQSINSVDKEIDEAPINFEMSEEKTAEFIEFFNRYGLHLDKLRLFLTEKMTLVSKNDIETLQSEVTINKEQAFVMQAEALENEREKLLSQNGLLGSKSDDVVSCAFPKDRMALKEKILRVFNSAVVVRRLNADIRSLMEIKLDIYAEKTGNSPFVGQKAGYNADGGLSTTPTEAINLGKV